MGGSGWAVATEYLPLVKWAAAALYLATGYYCWRVAREIAFHRAVALTEVLVWSVIALLFLGLAIYKVLDVQSALTHIGRMIAREQGWYANRRIVQTAIIIAIICAVVVLAATLLVLIWRLPPATRLAAGGAILLVLFGAVRAVSLHNLDELGGRTLLGLRWNWIVEIVGLSMVLLAARRRRSKAVAGR